MEEVLHWDLQTLPPVSYTHLDVYKRQGLHFVKSSYISEVKSNTQYLRKMQLYLEYWEKMEDSDLINQFQKHPTLSDLLLYACLLYTSQIIFTVHIIKI